MKKENSELNGFKLGIEIALGVIVIILLFFYFFEFVVKVNWTFQPSLNIQPSTNLPEQEGFCPKASEISILPNSMIGFPFVSFKEYKKGEYSIRNNSISGCRNGTFEGENINYLYCPVPLYRINSNGTIISQSLIDVEINPQINEVLSVSC